MGKGGGGLQSNGEKGGVDRNLLHYVSSILEGLRFFFCLHFSFFPLIMLFFGRWCT